MLNTGVERIAPPRVSSVETAPQLERHIAELVGDGHRHLVIDLADATFIDSTAMRALVTFTAFATRSAAIECLAETAQPLPDGWRAVVRRSTT